MTTTGLCRYCNTEQPLTCYARVAPHERVFNGRTESCSGAFLRPREACTAPRDDETITRPDVLQAV